MYTILFFLHGGYASPLLFCVYCVFPQLYDVSALSRQRHRRWKVRRPTRTPMPLQGHDVLGCNYSVLLKCVYLLRVVYENGALHYCPCCFSVFFSRRVVGGRGPLLCRVFIARVGKICTSTEQPELRPGVFCFPVPTEQHRLLSARFFPGHSVRGYPWSVKSPMSCPNPRLVTRQHCGFTPVP